MNFGNFLKEEMLQKECKNIRELYNFYAQDKNLEIKYRTFYAIAMGNYPPNVKLLSLVFNHTPAHRHKLLVNCYFQSLLEKEEISEELPLTNYIDRSLNQNLNTTNKTIYDENRNIVFYSKEQLDYLAKNPMGLKTFKSVLLRERVALNDSAVVLAEIPRLSSMHLIKEDNGWLIPASTIYRVPTSENAPPPVASSATQYLLSQLDLYVNKEGSKEQKICHTTQLVKEENIPLVFSQIQSFLNWLQGITTSIPQPGYVPLFYFACAKKLQKGEI